MSLAGKLSQATLVILLLALCHQVAAQVPVKRDFSLEEKVAGIPKICITEMLKLNIKGDCIKLVAWVS